MPPEVRRYDYRDETPGDGLRLVEVQGKIARGEAAYQALVLICNSVQIDIPQFFVLADKYGGQDAVKEAIKMHGSDYLLHLITDLREKEEASDPTLAEYHEGWLVTLDNKKVEREEALRSSNHG